MLELICQIAIPIMAATSIGLMSTKGRWHRWGFVVGLIQQPFWFYTTFNNEQWGIFILAFWYLGSFINGIRNRFGRRAK